MQLTINIRKKLEESANGYFEKAKKARKKIEGARIVIKKFNGQLEELERKQQIEEEKITERKEKTPLEWYEKFRWFITSEGFLCIGGRDSTTNEVIVKKHADPTDVIFHTEMPGSPFFVIKTNGKTPNETSLQEAADATTLFSRAWKLGLGTAEVYCVKPEQVSKKAPSGEYLTKGAFMISGKRTYFTGTVNAAVGKLDNGKIMCGPQNAIKTNCKEFSLIAEGKDKPSDCAKKIAKHLKADVDDVLRVLPAGTCKII
ncbi:DUF814 domain-containing protein [Candidatus Woesearchaeota archaeon]|nr:DUF814 domain-containing protein [Candidatus Woesearchaeota archaeon]